MWKGEWYSEVRTGSKWPLVAGGNPDGIRGNWQKHRTRRGPSIPPHSEPGGGKNQVFQNVPIQRLLVVISGNWSKLSHGKIIFWFFS